METSVLKEKLTAVDTALNQTERMFHQLTGQKALLEGLINDYGEKDVQPEKDTGPSSEGNNS